MNTPSKHAGIGESAAITDKSTLAALGKLPPAGRAVLDKLIDAVARRGGQLPQGMLNELQGISVIGVDPEWQVARLEEILNRWLKLD
jgi:hypothetical protein